MAADSGIVEAERLGLRVDLLVGDLDSAPAGATAAAVERHPADKDKTDLELAMDAAVARGATHLAVVAGLGGRVDHAVANVLLLASDAFAQVTVEAYVGAATIHVVRSGTPRDLAGERGELVTLMAVGGVARGVTTEGLAWALADDDLVPGSTRGVSNVFLGDRARVAVAEGVLLAIVAGELAAPEGHSQV